MTQPKQSLTNEEIARKIASLHHFGEEKPRFRFTPDHVIKPLINMIKEALDSKDQSLAEKDLVIERLLEGLERLLYREWQTVHIGTTYKQATITLSFEELEDLQGIRQSTQPSGILAAMKSGMEALRKLTNPENFAGHVWDYAQQDAKQSLTQMEKYFPHTQKHEEGK